MLTEAEGVPLVVRTTPANVNDETQLPALLESMPAVQGPRGRPRRKPGSVFGDRAYGTAAMTALVAMLGIFSFLAPRNNRDWKESLATAKKASPRAYQQIIDMLGEGLGSSYVLALLENVIRSGRVNYLPTPDRALAVHIETNSFCNYATHLRTMRWTWLFSPSGFVIGDNPVCRWDVRRQHYDYG